MADSPFIPHPEKLLRNPFKGGKDPVQIGDPFQPLRDRQNQAKVDAAKARHPASTQPLDSDTLFQWLQNPGASLSQIMDLGAASNRVLLSARDSAYAIPFNPYDPVSNMARDESGTTVTTGELLKSLAHLNRDQLIRLQQQMVEAGYYGKGQDGQPRAIQWGALDSSTRAAYGNMITDALLHPDQSLEDLVNDGSRFNFKDMSAKRKTTKEAKVQSLLAQSANQLTSKEDLARIANDAAKQTIGQSLSKEETDRFVTAFHDKQREHITAVLNQQLASSGSSASGATDAQADQFVDTILAQGKGFAGAGVNALGMSPDEWSRYADRAGLGSNTPDTPANEKLVAKEIALNFADQFNGSWGDVATAWFAGPGKRVPGLLSQIKNPYPAGSTAAANYEPPTPVSIGDLADRVTSAMRSGVTGGDSTSDKVAQGDLTFTEDQATPETAALDLIKREHPTEYGGEVMAARAKEFFDYLGAPALAEHN